MPDPKVPVLVVEDDPAEVELLRRSLREHFTRDFELVHATSLADTFQTLERLKVGLVLLDLNLPDSEGIDTFLEFQEHYSSLPVILLTGQEDEDLGIRAVRSGAQDYIVKGAVRPDQAARAMHFAIERQRLLLASVNRSMMDDLTGLYNRRGFMELAQTQIKLSVRNDKELILVYADLDNMKGVNDSLGHDMGDQLLRDTANLLRKSFRETDVVARIGGDEFAVLALGTSPEYAGILTTRLMRNIQSFNEDAGRPYQVSLSIGISGFQPKSQASFEELLTRADHAMYMDKRSHKSWLQGRR